MSFTRTERMGLIGLCSLLLILLVLKATMYLWVHPNIDIEKQQRLAAAWETFKRTHTVSDTAAKAAHQDAFDDDPTPLPNIININTADSATLVRLKGIGPATAGKIIARRNEHPFTNVDQLREVGSFSENTFKILKEHLRVGPAN